MDGVSSLMDFLPLAPNTRVKHISVIQDNFLLSRLCVLTLLSQNSTIGLGSVSMSLSEKLEKNKNKKVCPSARLRRLEKHRKSD